MIRRRLDCSLWTGESHMGSTNDDGISPRLVGEADLDLGSSNADSHELTDRLIVKFESNGRRRASAPSTGPLEVVIGLFRLVSCTNWSQ